MTIRKSILLGNGGAVLTGTFPSFADNDPGTVQGLNGRTDGAANVANADGSTYGDRVPASRTVTIAGSPGAGDIVVVVLGGVQVSYTAVGGDAVTNIAVALRNLLQADSRLARRFTFTNVAGVLTIRHNGGAFGNLYTLTTTATQVGGTVTSTASGATLTGGSGPFIAESNFTVVVGAGMTGMAAQPLYFRAGKTYIADAALMAAIYSSPDLRERVQ